MTPPRFLQALSIALGGVLGVLIFQDLAARGPTAGAPSGLRLRFLAVAVALSFGYVLGPLLAGRGPWQSFGAGLALAPAVLGWLLMFWPGMLRVTPVAFLGLLSGAVLLALYAYIVRHLAAEFMDARPP